MTEPVPLSQCKIWSDTRDFYHRQGIDAWNRKVPFYATCNPYMAHAYAQIIWTFMEENIEHGQALSSDPFYLIELGAGSGTFSFFLLKRLFEIKAALDDSEISFVYVMTDCVEANIDFWRTHPAFQNFIEYGHLDFAMYNALDDDDLILYGSSQSFSSIRRRQTIQNPVICIANYFFDSLPHDVFQVSHGTLQDGILNPEFQTHAVGDNQSVPLEQVDLSFHYRDTVMPYYDNDAFNRLLLEYSQTFGDGLFSLPVGGLRCIESLRKITRNKFLMLVSDKGYGTHADMFRSTIPDLAFHDSAISMSVNLDSVGCFFQQIDGDRYDQTTQQGITTASYIMGSYFAYLPRTEFALLTHLNINSPGNLFNLYQHVAENTAVSNLGILNSYFSILHWDPELFNRCVGSIIELINIPGNTVAAYDLIEHLPLISANYYYLPYGFNTLANIGMVLQEMKMYQPALCYYEASLEYFGKEASTFYNAGVCYYNLGDYAEAVRYFEKAVALEKDYIMAKGWIAQIREELESKQ